MFFNYVFSLLGFRRAVGRGRGGTAAAPAGEGYTGNQSEESGDRGPDCRGAERQTEQGLSHLFSHFHKYMIAHFQSLAV